MSAFIVLVHEFIDYFNVNIIPLFLFIIRKLVSMNTIIFSIKLQDVKIASIFKGLKYLFIDKVTMNHYQTNTSPKDFIRTKILDSKSLEESSYILEKNDKDGPKKGIRKGRGGNRASAHARSEEIRMRREQAQRIANDRLQSGIMIGGEININPNSSSQIGSNRIRDDMRRYQDSLVLPPILNSSLMEPRVNNNHPVMEPNNNGSLQNYSENNTNYSSTNNNQDNSNNYNDNNQNNNNNYNGNNQNNNNNYNGNNYDNNSNNYNGNNHDNNNNNNNNSTSDNK
jgi:hypothetical protein